MRAELPDETKLVQAATPAARRRTITFLALATITGLALLIGVEQWLAVLRDLAARNPDQASDQIAYVIRVFAAIISLSLIGLALVVARVSWRIYAARRFPPHGMNLAFDVRVVEGRGALRRAVAGLVMATFFGAMAVTMPYLLWRLMSLAIPSHPG